MRKIAMMKVGLNLRNFEKYLDYFDEIIVH